MSHINAKLLEFAIKQAKEVEESNKASGATPEELSLEKLNDEVDGLRKKNSQLVEQVK